MQLADIALPAFQKCHVSQTNKKCRKNRRASRGVEDGEKPNREQESSIVRREGKKERLGSKFALGHCLSSLLLFFYDSAFHAPG